jgi:hypothetical protein
VIDNADISEHASSVEPFQLRNQTEETFKLRTPAGLNC